MTFYIDVDIIMFFINMITICSVFSCLLTQAIKKFCSNSKKIKYIPNIVAFIDAIIVGGGGTIVVYIYEGIGPNLRSITTVLCMILFTWIGSMIGFDKVKQTLYQLASKTTIINPKE